MVETSNLASSLYLDQKDWIHLARLKAGRRCPVGFRDAAVALTTRISAGDVFTPLSESHVVETGRISNPTQRQEVATNMVIISRRSALAPLHSLWPQEADSFFRLQFGAAVDAEPEPFGKGLAFALGLTDFSPPWPANATEAVIATAEMLAIAEPSRKGLLQADTERERRRDEWKKVMTEAAESLVRDRSKYNESDRLAAFTLQMLDGGGLLGRAIGLDVQDQFLDFLSQEGFWAILREMPTLATLTELIRLRYPNVQESWKMNDYNDIRFLSVALAYCSAVSCDRHWGDLAQRSEYVTMSGVARSSPQVSLRSRLLSTNLRQRVSRQIVVGDLTPLYVLSGRVPQNAGTKGGSGTRGTVRVVPPPILKDRHHPSIWQHLNSLARNVDVPGSVLHHDEKFGGVRLDMMLPAIQGTTVEDCAPRCLIQSGALRHRRIVPRDEPCPRSPGRRRYTAAAVPVGQKSPAPILRIRQSPRG